MIRTGIADIRPLYEEDVYKKYYESVPVFRKEKADRLCHMKQKAQSIGVWILYERLRKLWRIPTENVYNLSHSGDYVLCSIGESDSIKIGCDLEEIKKIPTKLIKKYFFENEQEYIFAGKSEEEQKERFCRYWVLKESFMKATRRGLGLGLDSFEIRVDKKMAEFVQMPEGIDGMYYFKEYFPDIPYHIAVCSTDSHFSEEIQRVKL